MYYQRWDHETDIVVVGSGFAGLAAAIEAKTGRRFVNELADRKIRADAILQVGRPCIGIADEAGIQASGHPIERCLRKGVVKQFHSMPEIAGYYKIPIQPLTNTIERFNASVDRRVEEDFNKPILANAKPLRHPPYFCMRLWPKVHHTMGGVLINSRAQVLDLSLHPIKGFYAAGEAAGGVHGACRLGCCAIIDCLVFGRIAGRQAASKQID